MESETAPVDVIDRVCLGLTPPLRRPSPSQFQPRYDVIEAIALQRTK
jgi:hypothetical protein